MANPYYEPGSLRAAKVKSLFEAIARRYDRLNDLQSLGWHRRWKERLAELASAGTGRDALDLCCGTGDVVLGLSRRGFRVLGLDFSRAMLDAAQRRIAQAPAGSVQLIQGDALRIPARASSFDVVTISYGMRNLANLEAGLAEMYRVGKPGGRLLVLDFGKPKNAVWRGLYFAYLRWIVPVLGRCFGGNADAYAYILESLKRYPAQTGIIELMRQTGYVRIGFLNLLGGAMSIHYGEIPRVELTPSEK
jgi:demethylmenaquinone methyltransferase / 2-methoxy-6-polyprenyl-1,4-benzoquinol methylase